MTRVDGFEYRGEGSFRRWMQKLVINEFLDQLKRHNRKAGLSAGTQELHGQVGDAPTPSENLRKDEEEDRLRSSLERLEETDREILTMHFYGKMKIKEIAEVMGWHRNKTRDRLDESISRLQRLMSP